MGTEKLKLENLANGAAEAMFQRELGRVMDNIQDVNTPAQKARTITIKLNIKPSETRDIAAVQVEINSSLPGIKNQFATLFFGKEEGKPVALQQKDQQAEMNFNVLSMEAKND